MTPARFHEDYDPEPDYERADAAYDARQEDAERRSRREWALELVPEAFRDPGPPELDGELSLF